MMAMQNFSPLQLAVFCRAIRQLKKVLMTCRFLRRSALPMAGHISSQILGGIKAPLKRQSSSEHNS